jgi:hypothetical protein
MWYEMTSGQWIIIIVIAFYSKGNIFVSFMVYIIEISCLYIQARFYNEAWNENKVMQTRTDRPKLKIHIIILVLYSIYFKWVRKHNLHSLSIRICICIVELIFNKDRLWSKLLNILRSQIILSILVFVLLLYSFR